MNRAPKYTHYIRVSLAANMSEDTAAVSSTPAAATPKKAAKVAAKKPKTAPTHPKVSEMVTDAITSLNERGGSSVQAIKKHIAAHHKVDLDRITPFVKKYLKNAVASGVLIQTNGGQSPVNTTTMSTTTTVKSRGMDLDKNGKYLLPLPDEGENNRIPEALDPVTHETSTRHNAPDVVPTKFTDSNTQSNEVSIMGQKQEERQTSFFGQPGILAAVLGGAVVGFLCTIVLVMFIVNRMRKKDEGSYALDEPKRSPTVNFYTRSSNKEFYAEYSYVENL